LLFRIQRKQKMLRDTLNKKLNMEKRIMENEIISILRELETEKDENRIKELNKDLMNL